MHIAEVSPQALHHRLQRGDSVVVVDLRHPVEYQAGHIPGALSLFIEDIPRRSYHRKRILCFNVGMATAVSMWQRM